MPDKKKCHAFDFHHHNIKIVIVQPLKEDIILISLQASSQLKIKYVLMGYPHHLTLTFELVEQQNYFGNGMEKTKFIVNS